MSENRILAGLRRADLALLEPGLQAVQLPIRKMLQPRNKRVEHIYFIDGGVASVVASGKRPIEVGIIGPEGFTGVSALLEPDDRPTYDTYVQIAGKGRRIAAAQVRTAVEASPTLHRSLLRFAHRLLMQTAQTVAVNGRHKIEERLARWLLVAHDRVDGDELALTHEFLGVMLGVTRPGVTIALQELERRGCIKHRRGCVAIIDRSGLEKTSNGAYAPAADKSRTV